MKKIFFIISLASLLLTNAFSSTSSIKKVESKYVCMITNAVFPKVQIPVTIDKKVYYGCCENCKKTLAEKKESRFALDPINGKKVDKALAVIGQTSKGSVLYFENEKTFSKYNGK